MRRVLPLLLLLAPFTPVAEAQVIQGVVVDAEAGQTGGGGGGAGSGVPVAGADVEIRPEGMTGPPALTTMTDSLGRFTLAVPASGTYRLRIRHPAYVAYETDLVQVGTAENVVLEVRLGRNVIPLEPLVVRARIRADATGFDDRMAGGAFGTFLTRKEIEARAAGRTTDLLRGLPGVTVKFERWGVGPTLQMRGGFGTCEPAIFVDGVLAPQGPGSKLDDFLTPERIEGIEVYSSFSTAPAQYIAGTCGVILFWTRRGSREDGQPWHWKRVILGFGAAVLLILWIK